MLATDPFMKQCARRNDTGCDGRVTWEHALYYAGKQVQAWFAIVPLCEYHHLGAGLNKEKNQAIALSRALPEDLSQYPKADWMQKRQYLMDKYHQFLRQLNLKKKIPRPILKSTSW